MMVRRIFLVVVAALLPACSTVGPAYPHMQFNDAPTPAASGRLGDHHHVVLLAQSAGAGITA